VGVGTLLESMGAVEGSSYEEIVDSDQYIQKQLREISEKRGLHVKVFG